MTLQAGVDLSACRLWRKSAAFGSTRIGIIPAWNAVTLLNPAAAEIWDLLIDTQEASEAAARYAQRWPDRAAMANEDVAACLDAWLAQGLLHAPDPSPEDLQIQALNGRPATRPGTTQFRRTISVAGLPVTVEIVDPTLGRTIEDLVVAFPTAPATLAKTLRSTGPDGGWLLYLDGTPVRLAGSLVEARGQIVAELVRLAGGDAGWLATVHGAVLSGPSGPVFLAGATGAGKSTLSAALIALGWQLLAEDIAAFDAGLNVRPMPFALSIKEGAVDVLADAFPDLPSARVHQLGPRRVRYQGLPKKSQARRPERPRLILDVRYTPDMAPDAASLQALTPVEALSLFMNEESYVDFEHAKAQGFLDFVERTPAYGIRYGSISAAEKAMRQMLDRQRGEGPG